MGEELYLQQRASMNARAADATSVRALAHVAPAAKSAAMHSLCLLDPALSKGEYPTLRNNLRSTLQPQKSSQTSAPVACVDIRFHLDKRIDSCRMIAFNSPVHCSPSFPDDERQHAFQRAQQALTRRERRRLRPD